MNIRLLLKLIVIIKELRFYFFVIVSFLKIIMNNLYNVKCKNSVKVLEILVEYNLI